MKLKLNVWQRTVLCLRLGQIRGGGVGLIRKASKAMDKLELSPEEQKRVGYRWTPVGPQWDDTEYIAEIEIGDHEALGLVKRMVHELITDIERADKWTVRDLRSCEDLCQQLGTDFDEAITQAQEKIEKERAKKAEAETKQRAQAKKQ